jgi:hypothetical protein
MIANTSLNNPIRSHSRSQRQRAKTQKTAHIFPTIPIIFGSPCPSPPTKYTHRPPSRPTAPHQRIRPITAVRFILSPQTNRGKQIRLLPNSPFESSPSEGRGERKTRVGLACSAHPASPSPRWAPRTLPLLFLAASIGAGRLSVSLLTPFPWDAGRLPFPFWVVLLPDDLVHVRESFEFGGICGGSFGACG